VARPSLDAVAPGVDLGAGRLYRARGVEGGGGRPDTQASRERSAGHRRVANDAATIADLVELIAGGHAARVHVITDDLARSLIQVAELNGDPGGSMVSHVS
jgi:hypothetical protein